jgi:phenylacetate-CoA ligase
VQARQETWLRETVRLARHTVNGREQLDGAAVDGFADLRRVATIDKSTLRALEPDHWRIGPVPPGSRVLWTSGTTGEPLGVPYSPIGAWRQGVLAIHGRRTQGIAPWRRTAYLSPLVDERRRRSFGRLRRSWTVLLGGSDPEALAAQLAGSGASVVSGPARLVIEVVSRVAPEARPSVVLTNGELLTPELRAELRALAGDPADGYGMSEVGRIAWQCRERDLYHLAHDLLVVEVLDADGAPVEPGGAGDVVVTTLWNPLVPLLRYRTGDRATLADRPCRCGHAWPALASVDGRRLDWFVTADGQRVAPQRLWLSVHGNRSLLPNVSRYRLRQSADREVRIELVPAGELAPDDLRALERSYGEVLAVPVRAVVVDSLPVTDGRHSRSFVSEAACS